MQITWIEEEKYRRMIKIEPRSSLMPARPDNQYRVHSCVYVHPFMVKYTADVIMGFMGAYTE